MISMSEFNKYRSLAWPHHFQAVLRLDTIVGGTPSDPKVAEGWLKTKISDTDDRIRDLVATTMIERGISADQAAQEVDRLKHLNGFKRDAKGLYIEGRQIKSAIKEAASVALAAGKLTARGWGTTNKGLLGFVSEHIMVTDDHVSLGVDEPTGVNQKFVHTFRGNGIQYEEYVTNAKISFTVISDYAFTDKDWAMIWLTGEQQGLGASRSQGYGRYTVTEWTKV
jgi:hypothetical protein